MIHCPPNWFRKLYGSMNWKIDSSEKNIFLTFDDGPTPEVTTWVLELLQKYNAQATFFCIGRNVERHPEIYKKILKEGHSVGNHTYSHLKGWNSSNKEYIEDTKLAADFIDSKKFRPPYGRINKRQIQEIKAAGYDFYMWDVLSEDYNNRKTPKQCIKYVTKNASPGSIIVFHDSLKAKKNLYGALPKVLDYYTNKGFCFKGI